MKKNNNSILDEIFIGFSPKTTLASESPHFKDT